ncbi:MAG: flagellar brake protein [Burkholderiaceae bacterium]
MDTQHIENEGDSEELNRYQVASRREIISILRTLSNQNQLVRMQVDNGNEAIMTSVLGVEEGSNLMVIDCARSATANQKIAAGRRFSFETSIESIRILFSADKLDLCEYDGREAFMLPLPQSVVRLQRREYYRVATPVVNPVRCTIRIQNEADKPAQILSFPLQNVSGGGIGIIDENKVLDDSIGRIYHDCKIDLPGGTLVIATLEIRNSYEVKLSNGKVIRRIGCLFVDLPAAMLSAVQRYITKLERDQAARSKGLN